MSKINIHIFSIKHLKNSKIIHSCIFESIFENKLFSDLNLQFIKNYKKTSYFLKFAESIENNLVTII